MICDETGAGSRPSRRQTPASIDGIEVRERADAPEILPTRDACRARGGGGRDRARISAYHSASFRPKVIGSACTPCVRPIIGVRRCSSARGPHGARPARRGPRGSDRRPRASGGPERRVDDVGRGQAEVQPARRGPDLLGHGGRERDHVVLRRLLDLVDARDVEAAPGRGARAPPRRARCPRSAIASAAASSTSSHVS